MTWYKASVNKVFFTELIGLVPKKKLPRLKMTLKKEDDKKMLNFFLRAVRKLFAVTTTLLEPIL